MSHEETLRDLAGRSDRTIARLSEVEREVSQPSPGLDRLVTDLGALRQEVKDAMARKAASRAARRQPPRGRSPPAAAYASEPVEPEHLDLLLEPVIELASGGTSPLPRADQPGQRPGRGGAAMPN